MNAKTKAIFLASILLFASFPLRAQQPLPAPWKDQDIGTAKIPGKAEEAAGVFTVQGTMDIWGVADGSHLAWQAGHGDVELIARVMSMDNPGGVNHAKASLCIRESLDAGSRQITLCVTPGDGTQFIYRKEANAKAIRIFPTPKALKTAVPKGQFPCWLKLIRHGNTFTGYESPDGEKWQVSGQIDLDLPPETVVGLAASSHKPDILTKAVFDHVAISAGQPTTSSTTKRISQLTIIGIDGADKRVVYETPKHIEAPNWSPDGKWLVFNNSSRGSLWRIPADGSAEPEQISTGDVKGINNDHVLSPDGRTIYFSAAGHIYAVPFEGGQPRRISNEQAPERKFKCFLHGVSPDGKTLAYAGVEAVGNDPFGLIDLYTIPSAGGADTRLTNTPAPDDGPEYSSNGKWIYFNSELHARVPGDSQCYRMAPDGTGVEQLTHDERVNWFPHISPDMNWVVYISFPPGTTKHPANKDVIIHRMKPDGTDQVEILTFNGGQGTINVNSWSPDSKHFAFVVYPEATK